MEPITLRPANASDAGELERVAQLDSRRLPPGPHLVAVRAGRIDAAISLATGELVADPFHPTAELCELLRFHARPRMVGWEKRGVRHPRPRPAWGTT